MKKSLEKLSLEILKSKIVAEDRTGEKKYKAEFPFTAERQSKLQAFEDAKSWLWNMGNYNGQANKLMNMWHTEFLIALELKTNMEEC